MIFRTLLTPSLSNPYESVQKKGPLFQTAREKSFFMGSNDPNRTALATLDFQEGAVGTVGIVVNTLLLITIQIAFHLADI